MLIQKYTFGDTAVYYGNCAIEGHTDLCTVGLALYPADVAIEDFDALRCDSLVQCAFFGDGEDNLVDYTQGLTMRNHRSTVLSLVEQTADERGVVTKLTDGKGNDYTHTLRYHAETGVFTVYVRYHNHTGEIRTLASLQSFSVSGIAAPSRMQRGKVSTCGLTLHRMTSAWSRECRLKSESFAELGLDMSWARYGVKVEKFGVNGSMPVRNYFPFAAIEDKAEGTILAAVMEAPYSWQMEVYQEKETCALSGGLADRETGHWSKELLPGETFTTHKAFLRIRRGGVNAVCNDLLHFMDSRLSVPQSEESMPVLFNEYCTTWGCPSEENVTAILKAIEPLPVSYFVIDCGWYKPDDCGWCNAIGDWEQSKALFPNGIRAVVDKIHAAGKKAGVWFEFENVGRDGKLFYNEDWLLHRNGKVLTSKNRRFLDLRSEEVDEYLSRKMLSFLAENGFEYIKIDYNDNFGIGCDGLEGESDNMGENGRQVTEIGIEWIDRIRDAIPTMVVENCSSGGNRIEPYRMSKVSMCSFSDAHECKEIPLVAANVSRVVPARQSQIWATLREGDDADRIVWSLTAAMFGRICISGDVWKLSAKQMDCVKQGLAFYEGIKDIVRYGDIEVIDNTVEYYREPFGRQIYTKKWKDSLLVLYHGFEETGESSVSVEGYRLADAYASATYTLQNGKLIFSECGNYKSGAFLFRKV